MTKSKTKKTQAQLAFGGWLKAMRADRDMTAAEAAKRADVDATTWRALEAPGMPWHVPNLKTLRGTSPAASLVSNSGRGRRRPEAPTPRHAAAGSPSWAGSLIEWQTHGQGRVGLDRIGSE